MLSTLKSLDPVAFQKAIAAVSKELPRTVAVPSSVRPTGEGGVDTMQQGVMIGKRDDEPPAWAVAIEKRLERIEKARAPATSVTAEGTTEKPVKKGNFWSGIV
jgi:hypothetical protein